MSRVRAACIVSLAVAAGLTGYGHGRANAQAQVVIKIATVAASGSPAADLLEAMRHYMMDSQGGDARVKVFEGGNLGDEHETAARTVNGTLQGYAGSVEGLTEQVPELQVLLAPHVFRSQSHADRVLDGSVQRQIRPILERHGLVFGSWMPSEFRSWYASRPIHDPKDLKGLRVPAPRSRPDRLLYDVLGAQVTSLTNPFAELDALKSGKLDGFEDTVVTATATSRHRAIKHLTLTRHSLAPSILVYSKVWFDGLPELMQAALGRSPRNLLREAREDQAHTTDQLIAAMRNRGIEVHELTARQHRAFKHATRRVPREIARDAGPDAFRLLANARRPR